jgi:hypothetical protein
VPGANALGCRRIQERTGGRILYLIIYNGTNITKVDPEAA